MANAPCTFQVAGALKPIVPTTANGYDRVG